MYIYDLDKIKNVLLGVIKGIEQNKWTLNKAIEEDKKIGYTEDLDKIKESINSYLNYNPQLTIQDIKNQSMDGYGNIAIIYDGSVEITIESIIKVLYTHNNITLVPNLNLSINNCIVEIITQELKKNKYNLIFIFPQQAHPTHSSWESTIYKKKKSSIEFVLSGNSPDIMFL